MIKRHFEKGGTSSMAEYSDCERFRYRLTRVWQEAGRHLNFVMLNPSTATELQNDPTVERCERRARTSGFSGFTVTNIFSFRATDPKIMRCASDPIGAQNDKAISDAAHHADQVICAWGTHGAHENRGEAVKTLLQEAKIPLYHLGLTKAGHPRHPLYIGYSVKPEIWR